MDARKALDVSAERIAEEFHLPRPEVRARLTQACVRFAGARIQDFVPVFAERQVRDQLRTAARAAAPPRRGRPADRTSGNPRAGGRAVA